MDEVNRYWNAYEAYKETAEQHEFISLFTYDTILIPAYNDLKEHYTEEHAKMFIRGMKTVSSGVQVGLKGAA